MEAADVESLSPFATMLPESPTLTLRDYLVPVFKRRWMILGLVVAITAVVSVYYATRPLTYKASTQVFIGPSSDPALGVGPSEPSLEAVANQATLLTSTEEAATVAKKIGYTGSPASLAASVTATPSATTNFLTITASAARSAEAARIANGFAQQFIDQNAASQVASDNKQIATLKQQLQTLKPGVQTASQRQALQSQIQQLQLSASTVVGSARQVNVAGAGVASTKPVVEYGVLAAIGALIGGVLLAFLLERLDPRLKGIQHTEMIYQHPVLATVWHDPEIDHFVDGKPALPPRSREAFRDLRVGLRLAATHANMKAIVVASAVPDEGKSTVARNLALALSEGGARTVLVDTDLRKASLPKTLGVKPAAGLAEALAGSRSLNEVMVEVVIDAPRAEKASTNGHGSGPSGSHVGADGLEYNEGILHATTSAQPSLFFLQAGKTPPNPQGLLEAEAFSKLIEELRGSFDVVVIDSTPLTLVSDAIPVIRTVDAVLLVARSSTDARSARHASEIIRRVPDSNVIGLVVNDVPETAAAAYGKGYGYGYYGYGYGHRAGGYGYGYGELSEPQPTAESNKR